jgi:hypothetical protein
VDGRHIRLKYASRAAVQVGEWMTPGDVAPVLLEFRVRGIPPGEYKVTVDET